MLFLPVPYMNFKMRHHHQFRLHQGEREHLLTNARTPDQAALRGDMGAFPVLKCRHLGCMPLHAWAQKTS